MSEHSKYFAPSAARRWINCSGSAMAAAQYPDPPSEAAMEGTAWHHLCEHCLATGAQPQDFLGRSIRVADPRTPRKFVVTRDMATDASMLVDYVRGLLKTPGEAYVEGRVDLTWIDPDFFGRVDAWVRGDDYTLTVVDGKYGRVDVPVLYPDGSLNWQMAIYTLGILQMLSLRLSPAAMPRRVQLVIVQPRSIDAVPRVKYHTVDVEKIYALEPVVREAVYRVKNAPQFRMGDWCKYCPALGACPASQAATASLAPLLQSTAVMTATDAGRILQYKDLLTKIVKQAETVAQDFLERGVAVPGFKLVTGRKHRQWADEDLAAQRAEGVFGAFKVVSPAQMEKLEGGREIVEALAVVPPGEPVVAPESDKRPPYVARTAEQMFGATK